MADQSAIVEELIDKQGRLFSEAMGARIETDAPQEWFHWLLGTILLSARIGHGLAEQAGRALRDAHLHEIDAIQAGNREDLILLLNRNGYARYDNLAADYIRAAADLVAERDGGDLRKLRARAERPEDILDGVQEAKGIGPVGAEIFAREAQLVWDELYPRIGEPGLGAARDLGLPDDAAALQRLAGGRERFVRLAAALTRAALEAPDPAVRAAAGA